MPLMANLPQDIVQESSTALDIVETQALVADNPAATLADLIAGIRLADMHVQRLAGEAVEHARQAGALLLKAKALVPHGSWCHWLDTNVGLGERTAQGYMRIAQADPKRVAGLSIRRALRALAEPGPTKGTTAAKIPVDDAIKSKSYAYQQSRYQADRHNRIVANTAEQAMLLSEIESLAVDYAALDPDCVPLWAGALRDAAKSLQKLARQLESAISGRPA